MNFNTGVRNEEEVTIADMLRRCDAILDLLRPVQPLNVEGSVPVVRDNGTKGTGSDVNTIGVIGGGGASIVSDDVVVLHVDGDIDAADVDGDRALHAIDGDVHGWRAIGGTGGVCGLCAIDDCGGDLGGAICDVLAVGGGGMVLDTGALIVSGLSAGAQDDDRGDGIVVRALDGDIGIIVLGGLGARDGIGV
jgi:hypothetical protein